MLLNNDDNFKNNNNNNTNNSDSNINSNNNTESIDNNGTYMNITTNSNNTDNNNNKHNNNNNNINNNNNNNNKNNIYNTLFNKDRLACSQCLLFVIIEIILNEEENIILIEQLGDVLKILLDPQRIEKQEKDKFLLNFYDFYVGWLFVPFIENNQPEKKILPILMSGNNIVNCLQNKFQKKETIITSRRIIFEILNQCVLFHTFRMKYFLMKNSIIIKIITKSFQSDLNSLQLCAVKFIKSIISIKDEFYLKQIVKLDILKPIFIKFNEIKHKDNLITSSVLDLIDFIRDQGFSFVLIIFFNFLLF
jgi:hypothetical protein